MIVTIPAAEEIKEAIKKAENAKGRNIGRYRDKIISFKNADARERELTVEIKTLKWVLE